jgi:hypothetical protein
MKHRESCPGHFLAGDWLKENPVAGVDPVDRGDGLGMRLEGWPDGMPFPDFDKFAAEIEATENNKLAEKAALRKILEDATTIAGLRAAVLTWFDKVNGG